MNIIDLDSKIRILLSVELIGRVDKCIFSKNTEGKSKYFALPSREELYSTKTRNLACQMSVQFYQYLNAVTNVQPITEFVNEFISEADYFFRVF